MSVSTYTRPANSHLEAAAWESKRNAARVRIDWRFTSVEARIKLKRLYPVRKEPQRLDGWVSIFM